MATPTPAEGPPPSYTGDDFYAELADAPPYTAEGRVEAWMRQIYELPEHSNERERANIWLENEIISAYGLGDEETGELDARAQREVHNRMRILGWLATDEEVDAVDRARAQEFAYEFFYLVMKDANAENTRFDASRAQLEQHELATHDALTGLANRRGLSESLESIVERAEAGRYEGVAMLFLDLDRFKLVNDAPGLGHLVGDELLVGVANILGRNTRKPSSEREADVIARPAADNVEEPEVRYVPEEGRETEASAETEEGDVEERPEAESARLGGDEFVVVLPYTRQPRAHPSRGTEPPKSVEERTLSIAARLTNAITDYMERRTEGRIPGIGVSIGIVLWEPGMDAQTMLAYADAHMYQVKRQRRNDLEEAAQRVEPQQGDQDETLPTTE
jgi:GGDEF domain-containing protein